MSLCLYIDRAIGTDIHSFALLDAPRQSDSVKNKPSSLLDVLCRWERHLTGLSSRSGGEVADNS